MTHHIMEEGNYKASVILPHWNQSHLISNAIMSIKLQTLKEWELIIVDDGSDKLHRDNLLLIVEKFADPRIKIIQKQHEGLVAARNAGCAAARAPIIVTQDADDLSFPNRIKECVRLIESGFDVVYHEGIMNVWNTEFNCIARSHIPVSKISKERILREQYLPGFTVFKKKVWEEKPFRMETQYAFDYAMYIDWIFSGYKFYAYKNVLYEYVRQENSASIRFEREGKRAESLAKLKEIAQKEYGVAITFN